MRRSSRPSWNDDGERTGDHGAPPGRPTRGRGVHGRLERRAPSLPDHARRAGAEPSAAFGRRQARRSARLGGRRVRRRDPLRSPRQDVHGRGRPAGAPPARARSRPARARRRRGTRPRERDPRRRRSRRATSDGEAFAERFGLREVLREVEVVRRLGADEVEPPPLGVEVVPLESAPGPARADLRPRQRDDAGDAAPRALHHAGLRAVARGGRDGRRRDRRRHADRARRGTGRGLRGSRPPRGRPASRRARLHRRRGDAPRPRHRDALEALADRLGRARRDIAS